MLTIQEGTAISTIQSAFTRLFPYLKIEFFRHPHSLHGANAKSDLLPPGEVLRAHALHGNDTGLVIRKDMSVAELERLFHRHFGLNAQVFRKSGRTWLETTLTDDWSLNKQNTQGYELSLLKG